MTLSRGRGTCEAPNSSNPRCLFPKCLLDISAADSFSKSPFPLLLTFNQHQVLQILLSEILLNQSPSDHLSSHSLRSEPLLMVSFQGDRLFSSHLVSLPSSRPLQSTASPPELSFSNTPHHVTALLEDSEWLSVTLSGVSVEGLHNWASICLS